jgi:fumarate hydratase class II
VVWQTGSGTQTNMNVNEVIAHLTAERGVALHPNDHVNASQSSNDTFPSALHIAAALSVANDVIPAAEHLAAAFRQLEEAYPDLIRIGRTHLQDATPLRFAQEVSGWRELVEAPVRMLRLALTELCRLAIGGTAVGTGLNAPRGYDEMVCARLREMTGLDFQPDPNKFHALTSKDALVFAHGALKALAANLMKIANDIRFEASGPRCGMGELHIPENEPGSSIMPGKVNPPQCEAVTMVAVQVMAGDAAIGFAASQGNFQLNVFLPVSAYNFQLSARLLTDVCDSFRVHCVEGLTPTAERMAYNLRNSLMLVTCLTPKIGYEQAAKCAKKALADGTTSKRPVWLWASSQRRNSTTPSAREDGLTPSAPHALRRRGAAGVRRSGRSGWMNEYIRRHMQTAHPAAAGGLGGGPGNSGNAALPCQNMQKRTRENGNVVQVTT